VSEEGGVPLLYDPVVPQRDALLDADMMVRRFSRTLGAWGPVDIEFGGRIGVTYAVGHRARVLHRVGIGEREYCVATSSFRSATSAARAFHRSVVPQPTCGPLASVSIDRELHAVSWIFPNDRKLAGLHAVAEPDPTLVRLVGRDWISSTFVDYQPESSAVARCKDGAGTVVAYAKIHSEDDGARTLRAHRALLDAARGSEVRVSRPLAYSSHYRTLIVEPVPGVALSALAGPSLLDGLHAYGAALAKLHTLPLVDVPPDHSALERLEGVANRVCAVRPDLTSLVRALLGCLSARWADASGPSVLVHGDTNMNNAFFQNGSVALIDFDRSTLGSAAADIGNFLSLSAYDRALGVISRSTGSDRTTSFLRGYSSVRELPEASSLNIHAAAALAERAFRAVKRIRIDVLPRLPELLWEARLLAGGRDA
jgi:Ser/Thr protein kinase RdoA (MazF antagonist)